MTRLLRSSKRANDIPSGHSIAPSKRRATESDECLSGTQSTSPETKILCDRCYGIFYDFAALQLRVASGSPSTIRHLGSVPNESGQPCDLCDFFQDCGKIWGLNHGGLSLRLQYPLRSLCKNTYNHDRSAAGLRLLDEQSGENGSRGWLLPCTDDEIQSSSYPRARYLTNKVNFPIMKTWIQFCEKHHTKSCGQSAEPDIPGFRLIDCKTRQIRAASTDDKYAALSYLWGNAASHEIPTDGTRLPDNTPQTIEDALLVAVALGIPFLWVDRYCIDQMDAATKHIQINNMHRIYRDAHLTIIDADNADPSLGLPGISATRKPQISVDLGDRRLVALPDIGKDILESVWSTRGWTYQEGLLSRRRLIFTRTQAYFQCLSMHCCEAVNMSLAAAHTSDKSRFRDTVSDFRFFPLRGIGKEEHELYDRMAEYFQRYLSYEIDAINAITGVLQAFQIQHFFGLPFSNLGDMRADHSFLAALLWNFESSGSYIPSNLNYRHLQISRRESFPTWTWAGWARLPEFRPYEWRYPGWLHDSSAKAVFRTQKGEYVTPIDYVASKIQGGNLVAYEPAIYITGWVAEIDFVKLELAQAAQTGPRFTLSYATLLDGPSPSKANTWTVMLLKHPKMDSSSTNEQQRLAFPATIAGIVLQPVRDGTFKRLGVVQWFLGLINMTWQYETASIVRFRCEKRWAEHEENDRHDKPSLSLECNKCTIRLV